ncbi:MAG: exopolysaccharide biosynthesis polyprenyl glycosylphosphotransferase [Aestuariivirga sp.]
MAGAAFAAAPLTRSQIFVKRSFDILVSLALLLLFLPFLALIALGVWLDCGRPLFFRQLRGGRNGRPFAIYKFRTMTVLEDGPSLSQVQKGDPRVTRLGALLRRTSMDELPQLWNVLRGDMSLVGPRPHALAHDEQFAARVRHYALRQRVKPGLTGLAQIEGWRGETTTTFAIAGRVNADIRYIENWSFWLDIKIIAKTACIVLFDRSAY